MTAVAQRLGATSARFFRFGSVYSAYGSAISDVVHVYESAVVAGTPLEQVTDRLGSEARRDLRGEGFDPAYASLDWEVRSEAGSVTGVQDEPAGLVATLQGDPTLVRLTARYPLPRLQQPALDKAGSAAPTGSRASAYGRDGVLPTYEAAGLVDSELAGPLLVDGGSYTWLVTQSWSLTTDGRGDAQLTQKGAQR